MRLLASFFAAASLVLTAAQASPLTFVLTEQGGSDSFDTQVAIEDIAGGVKMTFTVADPTNTGDITAVFFNIGDTFAPAFTDASLPGAIVNPTVTVTRTDVETSSVASRNVNGSLAIDFDVAIAFGATGASDKGTPDFFSTLSFELKAAGLDVTDFFGQRFAVRGQSVGSGVNGGNGSAKQFGTSGTMPNDFGGEVPLPAGAVLFPIGAAGFAWLRRRARKA